MEEPTSPEALVAVLEITKRSQSRLNPGFVHDTRRSRSLLERPTQSEVGNLLLLQGGSTSHRAEASEVDGLDVQRCPPERNPGSVALARHFGCSNIYRDSPRSQGWHRPDHWRRGHHDGVLVVCLFVFPDEMSAPTPDEQRAAWTPGSRSVCNSDVIGQRQ
jgi:hypothetical protein